jgi:hypothetical protein
MSSFVISGFLSPWNGASLGCGWRDGILMWKVAANVLNKQSWTADKRWSSSLRVNSYYFIYFFSTSTTNSMEQSPSWEANWSLATKEIPRILWNPKVHHNRPPPVPILSQIIPVHATIPLLESQF